MHCENAVVDIGLLLSGELDAVGERALLIHVDGCADCRVELERQRDLWWRLGQLSVAPPDSTQMRQRLRLALDTFRGGIDGARVESPDVARQGQVVARDGQTGRWPAVPLGWLGTVAAALVLGVFVGRDSRMPSSPSAAPSADLGGLRAELHETRQMVTLALLRQSSAVERLKGVWWVERLDDPDSEVVGALLDTLAHDPNVNVRLAVIEAITRYADRPGVRPGAVAALSAGNASPLVQVALIDLLVELREPSSRQALQNLAGDLTVNEAVRVRAIRALQQLE
jgi:hypothetical protein